VVFIRHKKFKIIKEKLEENIPEQVGIFYALGGALILEGALSAIYHICPTSSNFQFDTTFMYLIAVLVFLKLYQFRHADIVLTAQLVFLLIGIALSLETIGYFTSHPAFWFVFIVIYILFMLVFVLKIYLDEKSFKKMKERICKKGSICCSTEDTVDFCSLKPWPCIFVIILNIFVAIFFAYRRVPGVSRYLLIILMGNMFLYEVWYICNKLRLRLRKKNWQENEGIRFITLCYFFLSILFLGIAYYFFSAELKTSSGTAAESRNLNQECFLLIFDNHDMWHFFSAAGLSQHFMFLLTLEDNNIRYINTRNKFSVF
jgi:cbb3-type cytochrome oxidase subunit 3